MLRGSMAMLAWAGVQAREPADLDWVVLDRLAVPIDPLDPYPYLDRISGAQQWPEALGGAAEYEFWAFEEFDTGGLHPRPAPDGLGWIQAPGSREAGPPYGDLLDRIRGNPEAGAGITIDPADAREDENWTYIDDDTPGVRLVVPWHADGLPPGEVRLDFARDETMPQAPQWTAVPRADLAAPTVVRTASRELSLAWKLLWLQTDALGGGLAQGKDLYDAVLLAEDPATRLTEPLLQRVFKRSADGADHGVPDEGAVRRWQVDWPGFSAEHLDLHGTGEEWLDRLARALT
ncbi:nucleotidyl transferase AbiEii/AbiGii toxin family protein [Streptacidiphilus sp. PAMC 29251]